MKTVFTNNLDHRLNGNFKLAFKGFLITIFKIIILETGIF